LAGVAGLIAAVAAVWGVQDAKSAVTDAGKAVSQRTLEERLAELSKSMRDSARLVEEVSAELEARAATARQLKEEAETAEAIVGLHKEQTEAVRKMMDRELTKTVHSIRADSVKIGIASFVAGGGLTYAFTFLGHK
jgi:hypothetical protein